MSDQPREEDIQAAILRYLIRVLSEGWIAFHVPNGGWRQETQQPRRPRLLVFRCDSNPHVAALN